MTIRKFLVVLLTFSMLIPTLVQPTTVYSQPQERAQSTRRGTGRTTNTYREVQSADAPAMPQRPAWVESALERSFTFLNARDKNAPTQAERVRPQAQERFVLQGVDQDDLGLTHVRLNQVHRGVPVFGRQLITHLNETSVQSTSGKTLDSLDELETHPIIAAEYALNVAKAKLGHGSNFAREPEVKLVVLPNEFFKEGDKTGATLVYQVELQVMDGTSATGHHQYFVDAATRDVVWYYNALPSDAGHSLYRGTVSIEGVTTPKVQSFPLQISYENKLVDWIRGGMKAFDCQDAEFKDEIPWEPFARTSPVNNPVWGNGTTSSRETVAVDAYWGAARTWDYFLNQHGRKGVDGKGAELWIGVHYGKNYANAHPMIFGDGDGVTTNPWVSVDVVGHEFTHLVTANTANLIYAKESGALNESFSDIFGTAVEFQATNNGNYLIAEQVTKDGKGIRSMANPTEHGQPAHYSNRLYAGSCTPQGDWTKPGYNDACGVHYNSGIPNKAFHFLAEGGTYRNVALAGIGRSKAEKIFYHALVYYLTSDSQFADARRATLQAAAQLYGQGSVEQKTVAAAWSSVGVGCTVDLPQDYLTIDQKGGTLSFAVNAGGDCSWAATSEVPWIKVVSGSTGSTASGTVTITVDVNTGAGRTGTINLSGRTMTIYQSMSWCGLATISFGQTVNRELSAGTCYVQVGSTARRGERFGFQGLAGQQVAFSMTSTTLDSYLKLIGPDGTVLATSDDYRGGISARLPEIGYFTLPVAGSYVVEATTSPKSSLQMGSYTLSYQAGCQLQLNTTSSTGWGKTGGTGNFWVNLSGACPIEAISNAPRWLEVVSKIATGPTTVKVTYKVYPNDEGISRTGTITIGTQTFTVTQAGT